MEVSNQKKKNQEEVTSKQESKGPARLQCCPQELMGSDLLERVSSLTELPSRAVQRELEEILDLSQLDPEDLTLDQLRESMLRYLDLVNEEVHQAIHAESLEYQ
ncbi:MAG: hypothetical protein ACO3A2_05675 [Bdellovibrionia bacterium]